MTEAFRRGPAPHDPTTRAHGRPRRGAPMLALLLALLAGAVPPATGWAQQAGGGGQGEGGAQAGQGGGEGGAQGGEGEGEPRGVDPTGGLQPGGPGQPDGAAVAERAAGGGEAQATAAPRRDPHRGPVTNLPLPRYVSLKGSEGNARRGPSLSHRIDWVFRHAGMPLRVTAEYGHWRRVEDADGAGGWVHYSLLSGVRTALIEGDMVDLHARPDEGSGVSARAEGGAIVKLGACSPGWCQVSAAGASGWVPKTSLWGVDPGETRE